MKKVSFVTIVILSIVFMQTFAQDKIPISASMNESTIIDTLKKVQGDDTFHFPRNAGIIYNDKGRLGGWLMRGKTLPSVYDLMNLDVVQFNDLNSKYDTELKRKVFLESEEGIEMSKRLKALKGQVLKYPFYFVLPLSGYTTNNTAHAEYNLKTKTLDIEFRTNYSYYAGFINFPSLIVKCHPSITQKPFYNIISGHKYNSNIVKIPMTEKVAIKVEDNIKTLNLIVEFKLQQVKGPRLLQGISTKFFIVDKATNEIYFSL